jgi:DNA-binding HxlR family transcriptional regulator
VTFGFRILRFENRTWLWQARRVPDFRYAQFCPLARAAEVLGNRWSMLILRELMLGPQRFSDLRRRLAGVSTSVLSERLAALEGFGVIAQQELPPPAAARVYRLTARGQSARPVLLALARFGLHWLGPMGGGDHFEADWLRLSLEAFAAPGPTPARRFELRIASGPGSEAVVLRFAGGPTGLHFLHDGEPADVVVTAEPQHLLGLLTGLLPADAARAQGASIEGDDATLADLPRQFQFRPEPPSRAQSPTQRQGAQP